VLAFVCVHLAAVGASAQPLQLEEGFEGGTLTGWSPSGNATTEIVTSPVRAGQHAAHMPLGPGDSDPKRTEITAGDAGKLDYGTEYWIGFSFYLGRWDAPLPSWATLFQFHAVPGNEDWNNCVAGRNPFTVTLNAGEVGVSVVQTPYSGPPPVPGGAIADMVWESPMELGRWYDWVARLKPSLTDGVFEVWLDGVKLFSQMGGNVDAIDDCGVAAEPWVYLKIGIYKEYTNTASEDLYYDEVRIFAGADGYDRVRPGAAEQQDGGVTDDAATPADASEDAAGDAGETPLDAAGPADDGGASPPDAGAGDADVADDAGAAGGAASPDGGLRGGCGCRAAAVPAAEALPLLVAFGLWLRRAARGRGTVRQCGR
jgi:hypothetical protein